MRLSHVQSFLGKDVLGLIGSGGLGSLRLVLVKFHELGKIELGLLQDLDLSHHDVVLKWEDLVALLLDSLANVVFNSIKYKLLLILRNYKFAKT